MLIDMADGGVVDVEVFVNLPYGYDIRCEVVCESGTVALGDGSLIVLRQDGYRSDHVPDNFQERFARSYDAEFQDLIDGVVAGQSSGPTSWDGYAATAVARTLGTDTLPPRWPTRAWLHCRVASARPCSSRNGRETLTTVGGAR